jgi:hypothetical protein
VLKKHSTLIFNIASYGTKFATKILKKLSSQSFDTVTECLLLHHTLLSKFQWDFRDIAAAAGIYNQC